MKVYVKCAIIRSRAGFLIKGEMNDRLKCTGRAAAADRYQTSNRFVASVGGKTGKVKAVNKGKAVIYVLGINGSSDSVVVTVK